MLLTGAYLISEKPIILGAGESMLPDLNQAAVAAKLAKPPVILTATLWNKEPWKRIIKARFQTSAVYRNLRIHWLGNTENEVKKLRTLRGEASQIHANLGSKMEGF